MTNDWTSRWLTFYLFYLFLFTPTVAQSTTTDSDTPVPLPSTHEYTIFADGDAFAIQGASKRVPMRELSTWCSVPPERADEVIVMTDPTSASGLSVSFFGTTITPFGAIVAGFEGSMVWTVDANVYDQRFRFRSPACDVNLGTVTGMNDSNIHTLTIEPKNGMLFAIFNVSAETADPRVTTIPRKPVQTPVDTPSSSTTTSVKVSSETATPSSSTRPQPKENNTSIVVLVVPTLLGALFFLAACGFLFFYLRRRRRSRDQTDPPQPTLVPYPPPAQRNLDAPAPTSSGTPNHRTPSHLSPKAAFVETKEPIQPYIIESSSITTSSNSKRRRASQTNDPGTTNRKTNAHPSTSSVPSSQSRHAPSSMQTSSLAESMSRNAPSWASNSDDVQRGGAGFVPRDPRQLAAIEQAVLLAGFSTQALLESLNRVREERDSAADTRSPADTAVLPRYRE